MQGRATTTNAVETTIRAIVINPSNTYYISGFVTARRTGGSAGSAEDGAVWEFKFCCTTIGGVVTQKYNVVTNIFKDNVNLNCLIDISGTSVRIRGIGDTNNNYTWHVSELKYASVGS